MVQTDDAVARMEDAIRKLDRCFRTSSAWISPRTSCESKTVVKKGASVFFAHVVSVADIFPIDFEQKIVDRFFMADFFLVTEAEPFFDRAFSKEMSIYWWRNDHVFVCEVFLRVRRFCIWVRAHAWETSQFVWQFFEAYSLGYG